MLKLTDIAKGRIFQLHTDYTSKCQKFENMSDRDLVDAVTNDEEDAAFCLFHHKFIKLFQYLADVYSKLRYDAGDIANEMFIYPKLPKNYLP